MFSFIKNIVRKLPPILKHRLFYIIPWKLKTIVNTTKLIPRIFKFRDTKNVYTHIRFHFGDNATHMHYLRLIAKSNREIRFHHFAKKNYLEELGKYINDANNIYLYPLEECPFFSVDAWKNYELFWESHAEKNNFEKFYIDFFDKLSTRLGLTNLIQKPCDFIFDSQFLLNNSKAYEKYDWLIVNSIPLSGQFADIDELDELTIKLSKVNKIITTRKISGIPCTLDYGLDMVQIASLSLNCSYHLMVSTGPSWFVLNDVNCRNSKGIFLLLKNEKVKFCNTMENFSTVSDLRMYLNHILNLESEKK